MPLNNFSFVRAAIVVSCLLISVRGVAQSSEEMQGSVMVRIAPTSAGQVAEAFQSTRPANDPTFRHTDIHSAILIDEARIRSLLGIPAALHGLTVKPYLPTHSIAFEDIRERSNPDLFIKSNYQFPNSNIALRDAEEKLSRWFVLSFDTSITPDAAVRLLKKSSEIELAEPRYIRHSCLTPNDSLFYDQYALRVMHVPEAWDVVRCDSTMVIADVDVGSDWSHEDLSNATYINPGEIGVDSNGIDKRANGVDDDGNGFIDDWHGWDFSGFNGASPDNDARPGNVTNSHGTHTAGIMAATANNKVGIAGVTYGARVIPLKVTDDNGGNLVFGFEGIIYAADMHAKAVNCSWGGPTRAQAEQDVVEYAYAKDCAVVAAAGNNGYYQDFYPAAYHHVLGVGSVDVNVALAPYSNFNTHVSVSAPGTNVWSTVPGNQYELMTGTSMASPDACGVVALVRQRFPWMSAGEAMQQVRATSVPIPVDSSRMGLVGHGVVNAYNAVTDTTAHSVRIENFVIDDDFGTGTLQPGEGAGIILNCRNFLNPVQRLEAVVTPFQGSEWITVRDSVVPFGQAGRMQRIANIQAALHVTLADSVPPNTTIVMKVVFRDTLVGYPDDIDYFSFVVNPTYLDLDKNNIRATFSSKGSIGYNDVIDNSQGSGLVWQNPPPSILSLGRNVLFQGGLMVGDERHVMSSTGSDSIIHVVADVVQGDNDYYADNDFQPTKTIRNVTPDHANALQELICQYSDSLTDVYSRVGVNVTQRSYEFAGDLASNAVVVNYVMRPRKDTVAILSDSTAAVLFFDWDIGLSGALNVTHFDTATQTAVTYRLDKGYPFVGVKIIDKPRVASVQFHAIMNDGSQGDIATYGGFTKDEKWISMTEFYGAVGPGDISQTIGVKNLPLHSNDSVVVTAVIALAENSDLLSHTIDETAQAWFAKQSVNSNITTNAAIEVYPNPFRTSLHITWSGSDARVALFDALGRQVAAQSVHGSSCELPIANPTAGFYIVDVEVGGQHLRRRVVATE